MLTLTLSAWILCHSYKKDFFICRELELSFVPRAAQRESISFWLPSLRSSSSQETPCSWCCHTSTQFPSRTQRHDPHPNERTLKYRKRYLWYSLSLMPDLLGSARTGYFPSDPDEISSLLCMVSACHQQAYMHCGRGRVVVPTQRSQFCVALCFLFSLFFYYFL